MIFFYVKERLIFPFQANLRKITCKILMFCVYYGYWSLYLEPSDLATANVYSTRTLLSLLKFISLMFNFVPHKRMSFVTR